MGCAQTGTLEDTGGLREARAGFSLSCWIKETAARALKLLTRVAYRSSRFWNAYLS